MRKRERQVVQTFRRICDFVWAERTALPDVVVQRWMPQLRRIITRLEKLAVEQDLGMRLQIQATARQRALADTLRTQFVLPLSQVARHELPALGAALRAPHKRIPRERLARTARSMADVAERHSGVIAPHLGRTFLRDMRAAATALDRAIAAQAGPVRRHMVVRAGVEAELRAGRSMVRRIDALILYLRPDDEVLAATWQKIKRYE